MRNWRSVVALSGGVGGARLLHGLAMELPDSALTAIVNTGDDFVHWGFTICPDLDTVMYTLSALAHEARGWGLAGETFQALAMIERYGGPSWFQLGDRDLGTHIMRALALARGAPLSAVTTRLCRALGVNQRIVPMAEEPRATRIDTADHGTLLFQEWFVRERCQPAVQRIWFEGSNTPAPAAMDAIAGAELVVITPSNPYVSIDPILTLSGVRDAIAQKPVIAVSPIVAGKAVKGPLASMMAQIAGAEASAAAVLAHYCDRYGDMVDAMVVEHGDEHGDFPGVSRVFTASTIMSSVAARAALARDILTFAESLL